MKWINKTDYKPRLQSAAPRLWNSLPETVKLSNSLNIFKNSLKTHLHREAFCQVYFSYFVTLLSLLNVLFVCRVAPWAQLVADTSAIKVSIIIEGGSEKNCWFELNVSIKKIYRKKNPKTDETTIALTKKQPSNYIQLCLLLVQKYQLKKSIHLNWYIAW